MYSWKHQRQGLGVMNSIERNKRKVLFKGTAALGTWCQVRIRGERKGQREREKEREKVPYDMEDKELWKQLSDKQL